MARHRDTHLEPTRQDLPTGPDPGLAARLLSRWLWLIAVVGVLFPLTAARVAATLAAEGQNTWQVAMAALLGAIVLEIGIVYAVRFVMGAAFDEARRRQRAVKESKLLCHETRRILRRHSYRIKPEIAKEVGGHEEALRGALKAHDFARIKSELNALDELIDKHLAFARKSTVREYAESIGVAVLIALLLRSFVVEAFKIPSGSMIPTLQVGDHIFVNKFIYGLGYPLSGVKFWMYGKPKRGDVIVFKYPEDPDKDFIKRVIGVEGDTVEIRRGFVYVNGKQLPRDFVRSIDYKDISDEISPPREEQKSADEYTEEVDGKRFDIYLSKGFQSGGCPPTARYGCEGPVKVPPDHVFVMGDNRDNSHDSRFWGFVPLNFIKGKALFIWYSGDPTRNLLTGMRLERFGHLVR